VIQSFEILRSSDSKANWRTFQKVACRLSLQVMHCKLLQIVHKNIEILFEDIKITLQTTLLLIGAFGEIN